VKGKEMTWNHRVIRQKATPQEAAASGEEYFYSIREVFYDEEGKPELVTMEPDGPFGTTLEELKQDIEWYAKALDYPILDYEDF
jgi:hypothetical protein